MTRRTPFERDFDDLHGPQIIDAEVAALQGPRGFRSWGRSQRQKPTWQTFLIGLPLIALLCAIIIPLIYIAVLALIALVYFVGAFWQALFG